MMTDTDAAADDVIITERLELHTLKPTEYEFFPGGHEYGPFAERSLEASWADRAFANPHRHLLDDPGPLPHRLPRIRRDPTIAPYLLRLAVHRDDRCIVGSAGFHDVPDERGMIEIGLGIVPEHQRQGLARELLIGMWTWVVHQPEVRVLRYTVSPTNVASQRLIASFAFTKVGEQIDDEDGLEEIFERDAQAWMRSPVQGSR